MALKKPLRRKEVMEDDAEALANQLADRPYGEERKPSLQPETLARTTISLPEGLLRELEDRALSNKRTGVAPKNVSALVRVALEAYLKME